MISEIKLRYGDSLYPAVQLETDKRWFFKFGFNRGLMAYIKSLAEVQYHGYDGAPLRDYVKDQLGTDKIWSVSKCDHNKFQYEFLRGRNPYAEYDAYLASTELRFKSIRPEAYPHQNDMVNHGMWLRYVIWAAEMGTGKTLSAIEVMEQLKLPKMWWVGPKSALRAAEREFAKWNCKVQPDILTYEGLVKRHTAHLRDEDIDFELPQLLVLDEGSRCKTPTSQRTEASEYFSRLIRHTTKGGCVILMSGSPAPKAPTDWWSLCNVVRPGFLREGTQAKFARRLGLYEEKESPAGGVHAQHVTWFDDERKCGKCGKFKEDPCHSKMGTCVDEVSHKHEPSKNEVHGLYKRMNGLVLVKLKKDCLKLPEKIYHRIECKPEASTIRTARLIAGSTPRAAEALILLRELSDGFQYKDVKDCDVECPICHGKKQMLMLQIKPEFDQGDGLPPHDTSLSGEEYEQKYYDRVPGDCDGCSGNGVQPHYVRTVQRVKCPKDDALTELLDLHSDVGRLVVYGGFQGTVDRITSICQSQRWAVVQWDGRGIKMLDPHGAVAKGTDPLVMFQDDFENHPRVVFVAQAGAAGMGITLTASPSIVYYSNTFNAEDRIQSEDRIHRPGCTGANIYDLIHLPSDIKVLDNLQAKRDLQQMTMGELIQVYDGERLF